MAPDLVCKAQALDNQSSDHYRVNGQDLMPEDEARQQEMAALLSGVTKAGVRTFDQEGVRLTVRGNRFVLLVPSMERDIAGRIAPILCHGELGAGDRETLATRVTEELDAFARYIGRSIDSAKADLVRRAITSAPRAPRATLLRQILLLAALAFALLFAVTRLSLLQLDPAPTSTQRSDSGSP